MNRLLLLFMLLLLLFGCDATNSVDFDNLPTAEPTAEQLHSSEPITTATPLPTTLHSDLYISDLPVEEVIRYFNEVALDAEFVNGGDPQKVQKWNSPIRYYIFGEPTDADLKQLTDFCDWLNSVHGFPGISQTDAQYDANLKIYFCDYDTMLQILGNQFSGMDAGVTFWYDYDMIYDETICIRRDLNQTLRSSVILEELYNGLGPVQDTVLRPDSVIFAEYSEPQELTQIDELILKLLYHPDMKCGMSAAECESIIRSLYY